MQGDNGQKHLEKNISLAKLALGLVKYAAGQNIQLKSLVKLVRATVLSRLEYGLHICSPISKTQFAKNYRISGATAKTSGEAIQFYLGFLATAYSRYISGKWPRNMSKL